MIAEAVATERRAAAPAPTPPTSAAEIEAYLLYNPAAPRGCLWTRFRPSWIAKKPKRRAPRSPATIGPDLRRSRQHRARQSRRRRHAGRDVRLQLRLLPPGRARRHGTDRGRPRPARHPQGIPDPLARFGRRRPHRRSGQPKPMSTIAHFHTALFSARGAIDAAGRPRRRRRAGPQSRRCSNST